MKWTARAARAALTLGLAYTCFDSWRLTWLKFSVWLALLSILFLLASNHRETPSPTKP